MLVNFTHSSCAQLLNIEPRLVAVLMDGNVTDFKFLQLLKMLGKTLHEFNVVGNVTDLKLKQPLKQEFKSVMFVEFEGNVISNKAKQFTNV
jgi:hypothetical protein